jgi:cellobiose phosphorylase
MGVRGAELTKATFETRRETFLGRCGRLASPAALATRAPLENCAGAVLDSVAVLRREVILEPGAAATVDIVCGVAATREAALDLAARYGDRHLGQRVFDLAWTREQVICHQLTLGQADLPLFARLAASVLYPDSDMRSHAGGTTPAVGQSGLWKYGISGDLSIVLVRIASVAELPLVRQMLQAHSYWHIHGLRTDLVIWNEDASGYRQELHDAIMALVGTRTDVPGLDRPGGVFVRRSEHVGPDDRILLQTCARAVVDGRRGSLADQLPRRMVARPKPQRAPLRVKHTYTRELGAPQGLQFFNGIGGFSADGSEYEIWLPSGSVTPAPWINVLANPEFGCVISESGGAYTFGQNAHEIRLTPWYNDAVSDESGEAFYIRDEDSGTFWSPAPLPVRGAGPYRVRHGFGYSIFDTIQCDIASTLTVFVAAQQPLKYSVLKLRNESSTRRRLSVFACVEWVLGDLRTKCAPHVRTALDGGGRAIHAGNYFNDAFARNVGIFATDAPVAGATGNRAEFIGRNRSLRNPLAMHQPRLSPSFGTGNDPCAALQIEVDLDAGEERELVFVLGLAADAEHAHTLTQQSVDATTAAAELQGVKAAWQQRLGGLRISTPDVATNLLVNGWLVYQVIACRLWARSGYYQSGGAYGFRDQLQDVVALLAIEPGLAREQILRCAAHQFTEGDVQHWWHPPIGRGVRTHFSDDFLWLPWAVAQYVEATGDWAILDVEIPFLEGRPLRDDEESYYDFVAPGAVSASVYEHCARAIGNGLKRGEHGLPLIGCGDWNDGFNRLGQHGRGESVWLAFFQIDTMRRFAPVARARNDGEVERRCVDESATLAEHVDAAAWDGAWYRRAYDDEGKPVGSAQNDECRIDSLPQSWAVLTASGDPRHRGQALDAALEKLVREDAQLIQLFDPPFDRGSLDPGYIKGYIPGTRENGGQYTHAAVWLGMACNHAGRHQAAWDLARMINPINHARTRAAVATYRIEPYVIAADVYRAPGYEGRGGWSWYTGSAGWMYRFIVESLLGIQVRAGVLHVDAKLPAGWPGYTITYRHGATEYTIEVVRAEADARDRGGAAEFDLIDDGAARTLRVTAKADDALPAPADSGSRLAGTG